MDEKNPEFDEVDIAEGEQPAAPSNTPAPRARNRTVMLTPEITGEVRARITRDPAAEQREQRAAMSSPEPSIPAPQFFGGMYTPGGGKASSGGERDIERSKPAGSPERDLDRKPISSGERDLERGNSFGHPRSAPPLASSQPTTISYEPPPSTRFGLSRADMPAGAAGAASSVSGRPQPASAARGDRMIWNTEGRIVGFLVSFDNNENGDVFELRSGRVIVTSEQAGNGNCLLLVDKTVSPMHAILRINQDGAIQVLDQLSEHGTKIKHHGSTEEEELSGDKSPLAHGDVVIFGKRRFHVCLLTIEE